MQLAKQLAPAFVAITIIFGTIYITGQQILRLSANFQSAQIANQIAESLNRNGSISDATKFYPSAVELATSYAPAIFVYDTNNNLLATNATLDSKQAALPDGVLTYTQKYGKDSISWQPRAGVREALVTTTYNKGIVAVGVSLYNVEKVIDTLGLLVLFGYILCLAGYTAATLGSVWFFRQK